MGIIMELSEIINELKFFLEKKNWLNLEPTDIFIHLIEELGEVGRYLLFLSGYKTEKDGHIKPTKETVKMELVQAFSLLLHLALRLDIDLQKAWINEFKKIKERFNNSS